MTFDDTLASFLRTPWGEVTRGRCAAAGMCKRTVLALLAFLEETDAPERAQPWVLNDPVPGRGRGESGEHWVLARGEEAIDLTCVQFGESPGVHRGPLIDETGRWMDSRPVDPDDPNEWHAFIKMGIHPDWRQVLSAGPPGSLPQWPYPFDVLDERSPWHPR